IALPYWPIGRRASGRLGSAPLGEKQMAVNGRTVLASHHDRFDLDRLETGCPQPASHIGFPMGKALVWADQPVPRAKAVRRKGLGRECQMAAGTDDCGRSREKRA